jgi:hypothetical protein
MGNYKNINHDFIDRTMKLISQYESILHKYPFEEQYNYTLLLNCLLGIIVMPKEQFFTYIPNHRISSELKKEMGLINSVINSKNKTLRELIIDLRNSIAHFDFEIRSIDDNFLIDNIVFKDNETEIAEFKSDELLPFLRYYADWIKSNLINYP